jgi:hypothetical protein
LTALCKTAFLSVSRVAVSMVACQRISVTSVKPATPS